MNPKSQGKKPLVTGKNPAGHGKKPANAVNKIGQRSWS